MAAGMDHIVEGPAGTQTIAESAPEGRVTVAANLAVGSACTSSSSSRTGGRAALAPGRSRHGRRGTRRDPTQRLGRSHRRPQQVPRRLRRARTSSLTATPSSSRPFATPCSTSSRPALGPSARAIAAKGLTPARVRRAHLLGHRAVRPPGAHVHRAPPPTRCGGGIPLSTWHRSERANWDSRARHSPGGRSRTGMLRVLAGRNGRLPHRRGASPTPSRGTRLRRTTRRSRPRPESSFSSRRPGLSLARTPRPTWAVPDRRHRARRVQRARRQQRLHQPDGTAEPARSGRGGGAASRPRGRTGRRLRGGGSVARRGRRHGDPVGRDARRAPQSENFTNTRSGTSPTPARPVPADAALPVLPALSRQVVKQADLVLALHVRGDAFTDEEKARDFAYYEALTVRDSSLSASTQAVVAAEVGHLELAHDYFAETALVDLHDLAGNTRSGLAAAAGARTVVVPVLGECATTAACSPSHPPRHASSDFRSACSFAADASMVEAIEADTHSSTVSRSRSVTTARRSMWRKANR